MTTPIQLLREFHRRGITLRLEGENILVRPRRALTDELRSRLVAHKPEVLALLRSQPTLGIPYGPVLDLRGIGLSVLSSGGCFACGGIIFWKLHQADEVVCAICHPPGPPPEMLEWRRGRGRG